MSAASNGFQICPPPNSISGFWKAFAAGKAENSCRHLALQAKVYAALWSAASMWASWERLFMLFRLDLGVGVSVIASCCITRVDGLPQPSNRLATEQAKLDTDRRSERTVIVVGKNMYPRKPSAA